MDFFLMVYYLFLLVGHIGIALVQHISIAYSLANKLRELGHVGKHVDIKLLAPSHRLRCKCEHFSECASCAVNTIEVTLIAVGEVVGVNPCVKRAGGRKRERAGVDGHAAGVQFSDIGDCPLNNGTIFLVLGNI